MVHTVYSQPFSRVHVQLSSGFIRLNKMGSFVNVRNCITCMYTGSEGSDETVRLRTLSIAFTHRLCCKCLLIFVYSKWQFSHNFSHKIRHTPIYSVSVSLSLSLSLSLCIRVCMCVCRKTEFITSTKLIGLVYFSPHYQKTVFIAPISMIMMRMRSYGFTRGFLNWYDCYSIYKTLKIKFQLISLNKFTDNFESKYRQRAINIPSPII